MKIEIKAPWHEQEDSAKEDRQYLMHVFGLTHSTGMESIFADDHPEYRATATIETDGYEIEKATAAKQ